MFDIPSHVFSKILLLLLAESLFRLRCVCKEWRNIIDDPYFIRSHANGQGAPTTLLIRTRIGTPIFSLSLDSLNCAQGHHIIEVTRVKTLVKRDMPRIPFLPVASCNGLILISHYEFNKIWVVWNPLTREFHELPKPYIKPNIKSAIKMRLVGSGIGYDSATDDYKVVRIDESMTNPPMCRTHIYSLKSESWKEIKNCPFEYPLRRIGGDQGVYLNGTINWLSHDSINVIDLSTEEYSQLPVPPIPSETLNVHLDALGGSLSVSFFYSPTHFDVWMMEDCGAGESWMKLFSLNLDYIRAMWGIRPIAYIKNKGHVLLQHKKVFFWFDIDKNIMKKVTFDDFPYHFTSQICPGSLVRLTESCDGHVAEKTTTGSKRKRIKKNDRRLKFSVTVTDSWDGSDLNYVSDSDSGQGWYYVLPEEVYSPPNF